MQIHMLWVRYADVETPELYAAVDEYTMDVNPEHLEEKLDEVAKASDIVAHRVVIIEMDTEKLCEALLPAVLEARVLEDVNSGPPSGTTPT